MSCCNTVAGRLNGVSFGADDRCAHRGEPSTIGGLTEQLPAGRHVLINDLDRRRLDAGRLKHGIGCRAGRQDARQDDRQHQGGGSARRGR